MDFGARKTLAAIAALAAQIEALERKIDPMAQSQADLDAALDDLGAKMDTGIAGILAAVNDIVSKTPGIDLSPEVGRVQKLASDITNAAASVEGLDVQPVPPGPTPAPVPPTP